MPRYTVHIRDEWLAVPCRDPTYTIQWLGYEALKRYTKNKPDNGGIDAVKDIRFVARRCQGQGLLDGDDTIEDVLEDNDFVEIAIEGDTMSPDFIPYQPGVSHLYPSCHTPKKTDFDSFLIHASLSFCPYLYIRYEYIHSSVNTLVLFWGSYYTILYHYTNSPIMLWCLGVGNPLSPERTRMLLALRINVLAKGYSGISLETLHRMIQAFNASCLSFVPEKGTVGASGDLAPLSHLALGLMGEGKMWSPKSGWADAKYVLEAHGLKPISLKPKEGLALINGTQMITSLGAEAVERAQAIARQADIIAAITLEVLKGTSKAFDSDIHALRPHPGQIEVAMRFRALLDSDHHPSEIAESHRFCDRVQDAYTMRCCPQVHGIVNDTIDFTQKIINTEINSATDNPMVFAERGETISGGNFHGEYPAKALDFLAIGVHELAAISERRIERLCNPSLSELPAFLVNEGGLNSGFMIAHCTAASLVSENKVLCHPSSVDSLSTSAATEDHVSMGGWAARKALRVVEHVEQVLAIELLAACQGIEFLRPLRTTTPLEKVYDLVRSVVKPWIKDRFMSPDIEAVHRLLLDQKVWNVAQPYIEKYNMELLPESRPISPTAFSLDPPASPRKRIRLE
uniref:Histidine ammonia-lyase n=1 Tax=Oncorhynchus tshawytscha TaxID=74940 RepID=A0A8C8CL96_ONCTS